MIGIFLLKLSKITFGIQPTVIWLDNNQRSKTIKRQADIYVFCVLNHKDKKTVIIVSHNKKNLINCDKVYQVKDNSIFQEK